MVAEFAVRRDFKVGIRGMGMAVRDSNLGTV
jgi:hypothetical protein